MGESSIRTAKTYGSLGAVIILLLWLYITGYCILVGGEVNSEIGRASEAQEQAQLREKQIREDINTLWGDRDQRAA